MTFPVVSADSDHRLLSGNPSGCAEVSQLYECLCEPWVRLVRLAEPLSGHRKSVNRLGLITGNLCRPCGLDHVRLTQGSQSLALDLALAAAPQLVEDSRPTRHDHRPLSCASGAST